MKGLVELLIVVMIAKMCWKGFRFLVRKDKKHKKSIVGKIGLLFSRYIHGKLDKMIVKQKENLAKIETQQEGKKVISIEKYKSVKGN